MSERIITTIEVLRRIRDAYRNSPSTYVKGFRLDAQDEVALLKGKTTQTVFAQLAMTKNSYGRYMLTARDLDRLISSWVTDDSTDLALRYLQSADQIDKNILNAFFNNIPSESAGLSLEDMPQEIQERIGSHKYGKSGEGDEHRRLKAYIASHPELLGLSRSTNSVIQEYVLPSLDCIDILFRTEEEWVGVEVKPVGSDENDLKRGLFQCIKYGALLGALKKLAGSSQRIRIVLALGGILPKDLEPIKSKLEIELLQNLKV